MAVRRQAFLDAGGYDEDMVAWGYEDLDLYNRLWQRKYRCAPIDRRFLDCIEHENKERIAFTKVKEIGRDWGSTKGTLLEHFRLSVEKIARGELVANRGRVGIGRVRQLASSEPVQLRPWTPVEPVRNDLREQNNKILEREIANGITTMRGIPNILFLELTRRCNLACSMCRSGMMKDRSLDMSEAVLRRIEEDLLPTARVVDLRGWGESLLRRDFLPIVERFAQPGVQLRVLSNGTIRKPDIWRHLMRHSAWVGISVDATENALLKELRGCRIEPIEQSVKSLVHWRDVYGNDTSNVYLTVTVSSRSLGNLEESAELGPRAGRGPRPHDPDRLLADRSQASRACRADDPAAFRATQGTGERLRHNPAARLGDDHQPGAEGPPARSLHPSVDVHLHHLCRGRRLLRSPHRAGRPHVGQHSREAVRRDLEQPAARFPARSPPRQARGPSLSRTLHLVLQEPIRRLRARDPARPVLDPGDQFHRALVPARSVPPAPVDEEAPVDEKVKA